MQIFEILFFVRFVNEGSIFDWVTSDERATYFDHYIEFTDDLELFFQYHPESIFSVFGHNRTVSFWSITHYLLRYEAQRWFSFSFSTRNDRLGRSSLFSTLPSVNWHQSSRSSSVHQHSLSSYLLRASSPSKNVRKQLTDLPEISIFFSNMKLKVKNSSSSGFLLFVSDSTRMAEDLVAVVGTWAGLGIDCLNSSPNYWRFASLSSTKQFNYSLETKIADFSQEL